MLNKNRAMVWTTANWTGLLLLSYLIGSFPTAYMLGRMAKGLDIRALGDGNAGAANVFRQMGARIGIAVWAVDVGKGAAATALAGALTGSTMAQMMAGVAVVAGHNWPFFLQYRGGRGASPTMGVLAVIAPLAVVPLSVLSLVPLAITRSATVTLSFIFVPISLVAWFTGSSIAVIIYCVALPVMVGLSHWHSLRRPRFAEEKHFRSGGEEVRVP